MAASKRERKTVKQEGERTHFAVSDTSSIHCVCVFKDEEEEGKHNAMENRQRVSSQEKQLTLLSSFTFCHTLSKVLRRKICV